MITHTVFFKLKHSAGSSEERDFLSTAQRLLAEIPGVRQFTTLREVSPKNKFTFGFSMRFANQADYDFYSSHPHHDLFVKERWIPEVTAFQEIDFVAYH